MFFFRFVFTGIVYARAVCMCEVYCGIFILNKKPTHRIYKKKKKQQHQQYYFRFVLVSMYGLSFSHVVNRFFRLQMQQILNKHKKSQHSQLKLQPCFYFFFHWFVDRMNGKKKTYTKLFMSHKRWSFKTGKDLQTIVCLCLCLFFAWFFYISARLQNEKRKIPRQETALTKPYGCIDEIFEFFFPSLNRTTLLLFAFTYAIRNSERERIYVYALRLRLYL